MLGYHATLPAWACLNCAVDAWLGLVGSLVLAVLAFFFGRMNQNRQNSVQRDEDLRRTRLDTYASFCAAMVNYRRAQLYRWYAGRDVGSPAEVERRRPGVAEEVRKARAVAWSQLYKVVMICNDGEVENRARTAIALAKEMKTAHTPEELDELSEKVHQAIDDFAHYAGSTVREPHQRAAVPPGLAYRASASSATDGQPLSQGTEPLGDDAMERMSRGTCREPSDDRVGLIHDREEAR